MIVAEVVRSGFVESVHHGSVAVLGGPSRGDVTSAVFPRSSNKPLQTVGMLRTGLAPRDAADLALISGSHYGEPLHVRRVRDILEAAGLEPGARPAWRTAGRSSRTSTRSIRCRWRSRTR
jgi:L-asparaginase II